MKVGVFEMIDGLKAGGVAINMPNYKKFAPSQEESLILVNGKLVQRAVIADLEFFFLWAGAASPSLLGKRFPLHDNCDEPYCCDRYFRQRKPEKVGAKIRHQLDKMTAIMGDRPRTIVENDDLPARKWPWSTRRNAWGLDSTGTKVVDRPWIITKQEVALTLAWMHELYIDEAGRWTGRLQRIIQTDGRKYLRSGDIDKHVAEWRHSKRCWPESRFEQPREATFDIRHYQEVLA